MKFFTMLDALQQHLNEPVAVANGTSVCDGCGGAGGRCAAQSSF